MHEFETGFVVRKPAWHGLADVLDAPLTAADALVAAGQDWKVGKAPLYAAVPGNGDVEVPRFFATYRDDTHAPLGVVGKDWTPVQNADAFSFMDDLVGGEELQYESCGVLKGGAKVYMLARHPENLVVAGDEIRRYLLCWNGHAGTLSFGIKRVNERVVCSNTLGMALAEDGSIFKARHTSGVEFKTAAARDVLGMAFKHDEQFERMAAELLATKMTARQQASFAERLIPLKPSVEKDSRTAKNVEEARAAVLAILRDGADLQNIKSTAWGALQAATEFADWHTSPHSSDEQRFVRNWMEDSDVKLRATALLAPSFLPAGVLRKVGV